MFKVFAGLLLAALLLIPATARAQDRCGDVKSGEQCGEGNGRQTAGGGDKVSHAGWPKITGILWKVNESAGTHRHEGTEDNDELLGHHGDDTLIGDDGKDVLWGDWEANNPSGQTDVMRGGDGNDFLYPSHGKNTMLGGPGNDRIIAYYGHGTIDCGPGDKDYAQTRWQSSAYKVKNCELIRHFCAFGSKPNGDCKKPGENALAVLSRQVSQSALLARLDAW
jgi:hypothetical protein